MRPDRSWDFPELSEDSPEDYLRERELRWRYQDARVEQIRSRPGLDFELLEQLASDSEHAKCESPIEQLLSCAIRRQRRDAPLRSQAKIGPYRVDFLLGDWLVIECDGKNFHSSDRQRAEDAKRDAFLKARGYQVLRFTGAELRRDEHDCARIALAAAGL